MVTEQAGAGPVGDRTIIVTHKSTPAIFHNHHPLNSLFSPPPPPPRLPLVHRHPHTSTPTHRPNHPFITPRPPSLSDTPRHPSTSPASPAMPVPLRANHHRAEARYNVTTDCQRLLFSSEGWSNHLIQFQVSVFIPRPPQETLVSSSMHCHADNPSILSSTVFYRSTRPAQEVMSRSLSSLSSMAQTLTPRGKHPVLLLLLCCLSLILLPHVISAPPIPTRLPKRYSSRDSSAPIIGTTGSTPLHFAAANGNRDAIMLLLLHGAHANRPDKHGITPEALARQNGWIECADVLKDWIINKDKDLREREEFVAADDKDHGKRRHRLGSFGDPEPSHTPRRRLHVKHSIDTALNMLKSSSSNLAEAYHRGCHTPTPPTSPSRPFADATSSLGNSTKDLFPDPSTRRPSLPHVLQSDSLPRPRKVSTQSTNTYRPGSAGEGAEESGPIVPSYGRGGAARRLGSKVSLLNLFRKGQSSEGTNTPEAGTNPSISDASLSTSPTGAGFNLGSSLPHHRSRLHQDSDASIRSRTGDRSLERKPSLNSPLRSPVPLAIDLHNALAQEQQRINNRDRSRSNASSRYEYLNDDPVSSGAGSYHSPGTSPLARLGLLRSQGHHRTRSGSGSSLGYEVNVPSRLGMASTTTVDDVPNNNKGGATGNDTDNVSRSLPRPGILRPHNRNGSIGQGHMTPSALRALRFDTFSSATNGNDAHGNLDSHSRDAASHSPSPRGTPAQLKSSNSIGSLSRSDSRSRRRASRRPGSAGSMSGQKQGDGNDEGDAFIEEKDEDDEEEYGKPIEATETPSLLIGVGKPGSSSRTSLSPIISNDHTAGEGEDALGADFPFSINRPPPMPTERDVDEPGAPPPIPLPSRTISNGTDTRHRGDSLSSGDTTDSQEQTSSRASTMMVATPLMSSEVVPPQDKKEGLASGVEEVDGEDEDQRSKCVVISPATDASHSSPPLPQSRLRRPPPLPLQPPSHQTHTHSKSASSLAPPSGIHSSTGSMSGRRIHTPFDIDIGSISTHAQAEALVEKARKEVMELANLEEQDLVLADSDGRTPLSARLAAYGESLALERRFRELEKGGGSAASGTTISTTTTANGERSAISTGTSSMNLPLPVANQHSKDGSGYAGSLYSRKSASGMKISSSPRSVGEGMKGIARVKRPSTAEGRECCCLFPSNSFFDKHI